MNILSSGNEHSTTRGAGRAAPVLAPRKHPVDDPSPVSPNPPAPVDEPKHPHAPVDDPGEEDPPDT